MVDIKTVPKLKWRLALAPRIMSDICEMYYSATCADDAHTAGSCATDKFSTGAMSHLSLLAWSCTQHFSFREAAEGFSKKDPGLTPPHSHCGTLLGQYRWAQRIHTLLLFFFGALHAVHAFRALSTLNTFCALCELYALSPRICIPAMGWRHSGSVALKLV